MEHDPALITDAQALADICDDIRRLRPDSFVAVDTEATGLHVFNGVDSIRGISVAYRNDQGDLKSWYVPVTHPHSPNVDPAPLINALANTFARHEFHNATYDWKVLEQVGFRPRWGEHGYFDTETMAWLHNENYRHGLKAQGAIWFGEDEAEEQRVLKQAMKGTPAKDYLAFVRPGVRKGKVRLAQAWARERHEASKKTWGTLTADDIAKYAAQDTHLTYRLGELQRSRDYGETDPWPDVEREFRIREAVYRMIDEGVMIDRGRVEAITQRYLIEQHAIEDQFAFNLGSPDQLAHYLYDDLMLPVSRYTDSGKRSTDAEALAEIEELHPSIGTILDHRGLAKMTGTYTKPMLVYADDEDRIHSSINVLGTVTGRYSSSQPNMQNIPRGATNSEVKTLFRARDGYELFEVDLHSAELFVGASITNDIDMIAALSDPDRDFHDETAIKVFGNADGQNRTLAKNLNYGIPYGIGAGKFATYLVKGTGKQVTKQHINIARSIIQRHRAAWPITHTGIQRLTRFAEVNNYIPLHVPGRYRHFRGPGLHVPAYTAFNAVVQGGVAELMKDVHLAVEGPLAELGATIVLQVHDSFWIEVPEGNKDAVLALIQTVTDDINPFRMRMLWDGKTLGRNPT